MAKDPAFLFYPGDYLRDTQNLSEAAQVAYDRIMCEHMRNICITQQQLKFFTKRLNDDEKEELMLMLTKTEGGYQIEWVADSIDKRKAYSESRRNNRKSTKEDVKDISKTYDSHMENEIEIDRNVLNAIATAWKQFFISKKGLTTFLINKNEKEEILNVSKSLYKTALKNKVEFTAEYAVEKVEEYLALNFTPTIEPRYMPIDPKTELPAHTLEAAERNQWDKHKNKHTDFLKSQWEIFLLEIKSKPTDEQQKYKRLADYTSHFLNWVRNKKPEKNGEATSETNPNYRYKKIS